MIFSSLWLIWPRPGKRTHALGVIKFYYLVVASLDIIAIYSVRLIYVQVKKVERDSFSEIFKMHLLYDSYIQALA